MGACQRLAMAARAGRDLEQASRCREVRGEEPQDMGQVSFAGRG